MRAMKHTGRVGGLVLLLVLGLTVGTLPALANHAPPLAHVDLREALSGTANRTFTFTINHPTAGLLTSAPAINTVIIDPAPGRFLAASGAGPAGDNWDVRLLGSPPRVVFDASMLTPGGGIMAGQTKSFTVNADVLRQAGDRSGEWNVQLSTDSGVNTTEATTTPGESLVTNIRVLQVQQVAILSPPATTDNSVTSTQSGVCARMRVLNAANRSLDVTPVLAGSEVFPGPARAAATPPCSGATLAGGKSMIASGDNPSFDFLLTFGNPTTTSLKGTASAPGATTPDTPRAADDDFTAAISVLIQALKRLLYAANTLFPKAITPGSTANLEIKVNTPQASSPGVNLDLSQTQLRIPGLCAERDLVSPARINPGNQSSITLSFQGCAIPPGTPDANFDVFFDYAYTDDNSHSFGESLGKIAVIRVDASIPDILNEVLDPGASQVNSNPPTPPAVTDNGVFQVSGQVRDTDPVAGPGQKCGPGQTLFCKIINAELLQYSLTAEAGGGPAVGTPRTITSCVSINSNADLQGTNCKTTFDPAARSTRLSVTVEDEAGLTNTILSPFVDVDNIKPVIQSVEAIRGPQHRATGNQRQVLITFSESVQDNVDAAQAALDWTVFDGTKTVPVVDVSQNAAKTQITLLLALDWADDPDDASTTAYAPQVNTRLHDRVGLVVENQTKSTVDRIPPLDPEVKMVMGQNLSDGKFWFNTETVSVVVGNPANHSRGVVGGYKVQVYQESNGVPGFQHGAERLMCQKDAAATGNVTLTDCSYSLTEAGSVTRIDSHVSGQETESTVYARTVDARGNAGGDPSIPGVEDAAADVDVQTFVFDSIVPHVHGVTRASNQLTVTFNEPLTSIGRNAGGDWRLFGKFMPDDEFEEVFSVNSVSNGATADQRILSVNDPDYNATVDLTRLEYLYIGPANMRYEDRATNESPDRSFTDL